MFPGLRLPDIPHLQKWMYSDTGHRIAVPRCCHLIARSYYKQCRFPLHSTVRPKEEEQKVWSSVHYRLNYTCPKKSVCPHWCTLHLQIDCMLCYDSTE